MKVLTVFCVLLLTVALFFIWKEDVVAARVAVVGFVLGVAYNLMPVPK